MNRNRRPVVKVICTCGARPNFMKIAPVFSALAITGRFETLLVHTGQHYDERMSRQFFAELGLPRPDRNLDVGSASHAVQTAEVMKRFEPVCLEHQPDWVLVVGDVNSTLACALAAVKLGIKVAHIEAGLRSFDRSMPEEINRILTDSISDLLFVTEPSGVENLRREGVVDEKIHFVGNVMIDTLLRNRARANRSQIVSTLGLTPKNYAVVTLHRPGNVDNTVVFSSILQALAAISRDIPIVFPMHPRTRRSIAANGLASRIGAVSGLRIMEPLGYLDFMKLTADAAVVLTDSGGLQEETTILGVPCLTLRPNTERPVTVEQGTNRVTGSDSSAIVEAYREVLAHPPVGRAPDLWDGHAAERIATILAGASERSSQHSDSHRPKTPREVLAAQ